jgi:peptide/nickel transport system permease protein
MTPLLVFWTLRIAHAILTESTLSFLGFSGTTLSWGYDIAVGRDYLGTSWWISSIPGLAILAAVIGINLVGDWFRDALDPDLQEGEVNG